MPQARQQKQSKREDLRRRKKDCCLGETTGFFVGREMSQGRSISGMKWVEPNAEGPPKTSTTLAWARDWMALPISASTAG